MENKLSIVDISGITTALFHRTMKFNYSSRRGGFTLVEIMIVVAIIALLAAIAVPGFLRARKRSQASRIINDLRLIDSAVDQYAIETSKTTGARKKTDSRMPKRRQRIEVTTAITSRPCVHRKVARSQSAAGSRGAASLSIETVEAR